MLDRVVMRAIAARVDPPPPGGEMELWRNYADMAAGTAAKDLIWFLVKGTIIKLIKARLDRIPPQQMLQKFVLQATFNKLVHGTLHEKKQALDMFRRYFKVKDFTQEQKKA